MIVFRELIDVVSQLRRAGLEHRNAFQRLLESDGQVICHRRVLIHLPLKEGDRLLKFLDFPASRT